MKNLLGLNLGEVKEVQESAVIYVTGELTKDLELIETDVDKLVVLGNILGYSISLNIKDKSKLEEVFNKYKNSTIKDFKKDANELLSLIKLKYSSILGRMDNSQSIDNTITDNKKIRLLNIVTNPAMMDLLTNKDKLQGFLTEYSDELKVESIINIMNSLSNLDGLDINSYNTMIEMMLNSSEGVELINKVSDKDLESAQEIVSKVAEYLNKVNSINPIASQGFNNNTQQPQAQRDLFKPILDINRLNQASGEMIANMANHVSEMTYTNTIEDTEDESNEEINQEETDNLTKGNNYTCNHCKDPKCPRKPGELSALCIHANDNLNKKGNK